jgi:DNA polymerase III subunit gamma/tau
VFAIIEALVSRDAARVIGSANELDERAPDYREVLAELAALLQKLALLQAIPDLQLDETDDIETYRRLAGAITPEDAQLFYQIAIIGRRDLELAPDPRAGFEMTLLRMLAFKAADPATVSTQAAAKPAVKSAAAAITRSTPPESSRQDPSPVQAGPVDAAWAQVLERLNVQGPVRQLAAHCVLVARQGPKIQLLLDPEGEHYKTAVMESKLTQALSAYYGEPVRLEFTMGSPGGGDTPARLQKAAANDRMHNARAAIEEDPNVRAMQDIFGATVTPESVRPND